MPAIKGKLSAQTWLAAVRELTALGEAEEGEWFVIFRLEPGRETLTLIHEGDGSICRFTLPLLNKVENFPGKGPLYCRVQGAKLQQTIRRLAAADGPLFLLFRRTTIIVRQGKHQLLLPNHVVDAPACEKEDSFSLHRHPYPSPHRLRFVIPDPSPLLQELERHRDAVVRVEATDAGVSLQSLTFPADVRQPWVQLWPSAVLLRLLHQVPAGCAVEVAAAEGRWVQLMACDPAGMVREFLFKPYPLATLYITQPGTKEQGGSLQQPSWSNRTLVPLKEKREPPDDMPLPSPLGGQKGKTHTGKEEGEEDWPLGVGPDEEREAGKEAKSEGMEEEKWEGEGEPLEVLLQQLEQLPGLVPIKRQIREIAAFARYARERSRVIGLPARPPALHMAFLGNPGTGKTMVARMLGRLFREMGLLAKGHVVEVDRQTLVGAYMGHTEANLRQLAQRARGGILFIDEAYALYKKDSPKDFGMTAINGLLKLLEDGREEMVVVLAGYRREMEEFFTANPGLRERVPFHLQFPDYTQEELLHIAEWMARQEHYQLTGGAKDALLRQVMRRKLDETFSNARTVRNVLEKAKLRHAVRLQGQEGAQENYLTLTAEDFSEDEDTADTLEQAFRELDRLVGLHEVKRFVRQLCDLLVLEQKRRVHGLSADPPVLHMAFVGHPGTGKTTVARLLGRILRLLGLLPRGHFVEVSRKDLVAGYLGQTALKTAERVKEALGGVLFIDEAYALAGDDFGEEALAVLIKEMEDKKGLFCVILAAYPAEMEQLLQANPGLRSRIRFTLSFPDFSASELVEIVKRKAEQERYRLTPEAEEKLWHYFLDQCLDADESFGNGRLAEQIFTQAKMCVSQRIARLSEVEGEALTWITAEDIAFEK